MHFDYHIIANFSSGAGKGKRIGLEVEKILQSKQLAFEFHQTKYPNHASQIAKGLAETLGDENPRIIVIGGDGTLHEVISGFFAAGIILPIGYLPAGTGNDFARSISLNKDTKKGLAAIIEAKEPVEVECFKYYDHLNQKSGIGLNSMGFGLDSEVNALTSMNKKNTFKVGALGLDNTSYLAKIITAFKERKTYSVEVSVDGHSETHDDVLITGVMNHPYFGGGIKIDPLSASNDHELALMIIHNLSFLTLLRLFPLVLTTGSHVKTRYFRRFPGQKITIRLLQPALGQVDGEVLPPAAYHMDYELATFKLWR